MKLLMNLALAVILIGSLSACWTAVGAAGGYIYSEEKDKTDGDAD